MPTLIGTFMFGPAAGIFISLVKDLIHLLSSQTGGVGELSDFLIYRYHKSKKGALLACLSGTAAVTVVGALTNRFLIIPFYSKLMPIDAIVSACNAVNPMIDSIDGYILFGAMPFNLIKGLIRFDLYGLQKIEPFDERFPDGAGRKKVGCCKRIGGLLVHRKVCGPKCFAR